MSHLHRFHVPAETPDTGVVDLAPQEAHHALKVVRIREGDTVGLFDGRGRAWEGQVTACTRRDVTVALERLERVPPPPPLTLLAAHLQQEKAMEFVVRRATELGATEIVFFRAERSEKAVDKEEKWRRMAVEACKQCGRAWLPAFRTAPSLGAALESTEGALLAAVIAPEARALGPSLFAGEAAVRVVIGPEGDFTDGEVERLRDAGAQFFSLGDTVFRAEMAATVALTIVQYLRGELGT